MNKVKNMEKEKPKKFSGADLEMRSIQQEFGFYDDANNVKLFRVAIAQLKKEGWKIDKEKSSKDGLFNWVVMRRFFIDY